MYENASIYFSLVLFVFGCSNYRSRLFAAVIIMLDKYVVNAHESV